MEVDPGTAFLGILVIYFDKYDFAPENFIRK